MGKRHLGPMIWFEEYRTCSCSFVADLRRDLPGYCPRHGHNKRRRLQLPDNGIVRGYVETG